MSHHPEEFLRLEEHHKQRGDHITTIHSMFGFATRLCRHALSTRAFPDGTTLLFARDIQKINEKTYTLLSPRDCVHELKGIGADLIVIHTQSTCMSCMALVRRQWKWGLENIFNRAVLPTSPCRTTATVQLYKPKAELKESREQMNYCS